MRDLKGVSDRERSNSTGNIAAARRLRTSLGELGLISTISMFRTAVEVTAGELSIESSFSPTRPRQRRALRATGRERRGKTTRGTARPAGATAAAAWRRPFERPAHG